MFTHNSHAIHNLNYNKYDFKWSLRTRLMTTENILKLYLLNSNDLSSFIYWGIQIVGRMNGNRKYSPFGVPGLGRVWKVLCIMITTDNRPADTDFCFSSAINLLFNVVIDDALFPFKILMCFVLMVDWLKPTLPKIDGVGRAWGHAVDRLEWQRIMRVLVPGLAYWILIKDKSIWIEYSLADWLISLFYTIELSNSN